MIWILAVSVCGAALSASAENTQTGGALTAAQTEQTTTLSDTETNADTAAELELFLPESYEQYLDLENPSDFAINENYIAIADNLSTGNSCIYIYTRNGTNSAYSVYRHDNSNELSSLNLFEYEGNSYLFFLETGGYIHGIDCSDIEGEPLEIEFASNPIALIINGTEVYYAESSGNSTNIFYASLTVQDGAFQITGAKQLNENALESGRAAFTIYNDSVYLATANQISVCTPQSISSGDYKASHYIASFAVVGGNEGEIIYTTEDGYLYFLDSNENYLYNSDFRYTGVEYSDGADGTFVYIYATNGSILRYRINEENLAVSSFDIYEITKYSDSDSRISNASDISIYGEKLVIADRGNNRVVVYDGQYSSQTPQKPSAEEPNPNPIETPMLVCAGEKNYLVITDSMNAFLYDYGSDTPTVHQLSASAISAAYANGKFYIICSNGNTYELDGETAAISSPGNPSITAPKNIAADLFGNIYVLTQSGQVNAYTVEQFLSQSTATSKRVATFDADVKEITVDYAQNIYGIGDSAVYKNDLSSFTRFDLSSVVYSEDTLTPVSFTFDIESGDVYILSDGFIVRAQLGTNAPASLSNIDADGLYDAMYNAVLDSGSAEDLLVNVPAGSVLLAADSGITSSTAVFPYAGYERTDEARAGVRVCELDAGTVVAFYEYIPSQSAGAPPTRTYSLCLVLKNDSLPLESLAGYTAAETPFAGYTTHAIGLYRFPLLQTGGSAVYSGGILLDHSQMVTVLGTISYSVASDAEGYGLDFEYYFVRVGSGDSAVYGFVPKNYIIDYYAPSSWDGEEFTFRYVRRGEEITLQNGGEPITLGGDTRVKVYGEPDENNMVNVTYTDEDGIVWSGLVNADLLYEATPSALIVLVIVLVVTAAVIVSTCYLILRKQPTLQ